MKTNHDNLNLEELTRKNPFSIPEGYMEGLTDRIMSQLPEQVREEPKPISLMERIRPWLYMAAMFAGLGLFLKLMIGMPDQRQDASSSLLVKADRTTEVYEISGPEETEDFLNFLEDQSSSYSLEEEMGEIE